MKILLVAQTWGPRNGPGVFVARLARGLGAAGHKVIGAAPADALRSSRAQCDGVDLALVRSVALAPFYPEVRVTLAGGRPMRRLIAEFGPDVIHIQDHYPLCEAAVRAAAAARVVVIGTNHFLPSNTVPHVPLVGAWRAARPHLERLLWRSVRRVLGRATRLTAPSAAGAAILRAACPGVPVETVSNGVELERFRPTEPAQRAAARRRHGIDPDGLVCLYVGRLDREKRIDTLLAATARLAHPRLQLVIVGRGRDERRLRALAAALRLGRRALFAGFVSDEALPALVASADVFAMPSDSELQSIATLEAMACGVPALAADACALPELVLAGVNGELFAPGDPQEAARALERLLDPERRAALGSAARRTALAHGLPATVARFAAIYESSRSTSSASRPAQSATRWRMR